jgi:hypothetical protein
VERKQVEGKSSFDSCFAGFPLEGSHPFSDFFLVLATPGLRTALGHAAERAEGLQTSYNSSEQELQELRNAALETCRVVEEGEAQASSSLASRLRALSGHVTERMRRALRLGIQKALGVVRSHYEVDFEGGGLRRSRGCRGRGGDGASGRAGRRRRRDARQSLRGISLPGRC